jgi:TolA-binding protein
LSISFNLNYLPAYSQTNIDSISGRFQQLSKQLADLEKYVYNNEKQSNGSVNTGQQKRIVALENAVKELRGIVEVDLSKMKNDIDKIYSDLENIQSSGNVSQSLISNNSNSLEQELLLLKDKLRLIDSRFNSTVDLIGKSEIRIMRLESLISTSSLQDNQNLSNNSIPNILEDNELQTNNDISPNTERSIETGDVEISSKDNGTLGLLSLDSENSEEVVQRILPDVTPEDQFKFSLELALKRKYDEAELALKEFMTFNPAHERNKDAHYWYGGVLFKQKKYEDSAFSDIDFNDKYPDDPRTVDTT